MAMTATTTATARNPAKRQSDGAVRQNDGKGVAFSARFDDFLTKLQIKIDYC